MELTKRQEEGLRTSVQRYRNKEKYTVISGYAGTGKSTLVKFIVEALGVDPDVDVAYCAFTGKAAQVLISKGCYNATTVHKLIYTAIPKSDGSFSFKKKDELEYKIIIVDECSMLPRTMMNTLLSYPEVYVIFCGDPGQLPPVDKDQDNHLLDHPHVFLDEIMRQAQDSGIIQLSMLIREGKSIDNFKSDDALVLPKSALNTGMLEWADQILCATNKTRIFLNEQCRQLKGFTKPVEENEKVIILANEWNTVSNKDNPLTNGCTGVLTDVRDSKFDYPKFLGIKDNSMPILSAKFTTFEGDEFGRLNFDKQLLLTGTKYLSPIQEYRIRRTKFIAGRVPYELAYGYAITTHKAQGSSWPNVLVIEEGFPYNPEEHMRWAYTAVTRAEKRLVILR